MPDWLGWLVLAGLLGVAELATLRFAAGLMALAAIAAAVVAAVGGGPLAEVWSARAYDQTPVIAEGTRVTVYAIEGATALVYTLEQ